MSTSLTSYDEIYVLSDIHMGGRKDAQVNFQIFNSGERLQRLIQFIAEQRPGEEVALVLNGDIIDSLAEDEVPGYVALSSESALRMMQHLVTDPSFRPVWDGLAHFLTSPGRHLVFVLGNHDIELSLPLVEHFIRRHLAPNGGEVQSRIRFATHGGGFACRVAGARVFCTHGNEVDGWNRVDYDSLGQLANAMNAGRAVEPSKWIPNSGTRLVVDIMNDIKRSYPFVDLLKPEAAAVGGVLLALDKDVFKHVDIASAFPILRDRIRDKLIDRNLLGAEAAGLSTVSTEIVAQEAVNELLGPNLSKGIKKTALGPDASEDDLLRVAEDALARGEATVLAGEEVIPETLGAWDIVSGLVGRISKPEALRLALKDWLEDDTTFLIDYKDDLFNEMMQRVGDQVDFVVTGHTHKPRALRSERTNYYNCGTWIRTLRLTAEVLEDADAFEKKVWPALKAGRMESLDSAEIPGPGGTSVPLLLDQKHVVRISAHGDRATGDLLRVTETPDGTVQLNLETGTTSFRAG